MTGAVFCLALSTVTGFCLAVLFLPLSRRNAGNMFLNGFLGAPAGLGLFSCLFYLLLLVNAGWLLIPVELTVLVVLSIFAFLRLRRSPGPERAKGPAREPWALHEWILAAILAVVVAVSLVSSILLVLSLPDGGWDAWTIWNLHGRFIYRGAAEWSVYLRGGIDWTHPDYPLLLPLSVARCWSYGGAESEAGPIGIAVFFALCTAGLLISGVSAMRGRGQGALGGILLLGSPVFIMLATQRIADIPVSFFVLAGVILLCIHDGSAERDARLLAASGLFAALAAWTKNEGLLFLLVLLLARFVTAFYNAGWKNACRQSLVLLLGAAPVLVALLHFKFVMAPSTDIFAGRAAGDVVAGLCDPSRWGLIVSHYIRAAFTFTGDIPYVNIGYRFNAGSVGAAWLILGLLVGGLGLEKRFRSGAALTGLTIGLMALGYAAVYAITPLELRYHVPTSLYRLLMHLWPASILLFLLVARAPKDGLPEMRELFGGLSKGDSAKPGQTLRKAGKRKKGR